MRDQRDIEYSVVHIQNWLVMVTYIGKCELTHDRHEERLKLTVVSPARTHSLDFIYTFQISNLAAYDIKDAKEFKNLKQFYYYLKFNAESIRFRQDNGEGLLSVQYATNTNNFKKEKPIAHIRGGTRLVVESQAEHSKRMKQLEDQKKMKIEMQKKLDNDPQVIVYEDTLVVESVDDFLNEKAKQAKRIVLKFCQMDVYSLECEMKNDREINRLAIDKFLATLKGLSELRELNIQWHKLSTTKAIIQVIQACEKLVNLRVLTFENQGNAFDKSCIAKINKYSALQKLEEVSCFFNISDEDDYFEESWWHPEHTEKYKGKEPIPSEEWDVFAEHHKNLNSIWIPKNGEHDIKLLKKRQWKKLALGYYEDQDMKDEYWKNIKEIFKPDMNKLTSLCLTKIKDINDDALAAIINANSKTLRHFTLSWCEKQTDNALNSLGKCNLKSFCLRHSPLQENPKVKCQFLNSPMMETLQSLTIQNFKNTYDRVLGFLASKQSRNLTSLSLPRNEWINKKLLDNLLGRKNMTKLNLYNTKLKEIQNMGEIISSLSHLRVLNLGATDLELPEIGRMVAPLIHLKKLNISDRRTNNNMNRNYYQSKWEDIRYPDGAQRKPYDKLDNNEKKQFVARLANRDLTAILKVIPRVTHLDIRNLGGDERPFVDFKLVPNLRFVGCEFELYKQIQALDRRGITFV